MKNLKLLAALLALTIGLAGCGKGSSASSSNPRIERNSFSEHSLSCDKVKILFLAKIFMALVERFVEAKSKSDIFSPTFNICFRYRDREREGAVPPVTKEEVAVMKQALDLFNSYARGGIEILYEAFTSDAIINQDDAVDYAYKMIYDQQAHADVQSSDLDQLLKPEY